MSLMSYNEIQLLLDDGVVVYAKPEHINSASLDIQLGNKLLIERVDHVAFNKGSLRRISLKNRDKLHMVEHDLEREGPYILYPGEFILAHSVEIFHLPNNISAEYKLKSSMARIGLDHLNAGWCDAGWHGSVLTLELKNCSRSHEIILEAGDLIGQMIFFLHAEVPVSKSYAIRGQYNNDHTVSGAKINSRSIIYGDKEEETAQEIYEDGGVDSYQEEEVPRRVIDISELREMLEGEEN